ncbi:hypothetical protein [Streptomyces clavuligerus]|uniref:hypothetical protein n=1 Tax=Streptomyces clavuligerus TaxID=1901 RepID=UPI00020D9453|nr:hypothetical protein [Streptomyces clavuligerus]ANW18870.1 hypothetical protein BB341_11835 [Streptomyces clavuligerus]AXU13443.1 hypothetical protein D1794_12250 [Streptomyces clavuligerus]MBY6303403.1 hypothetical protein [Streptomyces clavuligerus]QCS06226.1 hypothetical protein CRV15_11680 [Streptomyces clavuligerus]QPJ94417.1 hypothetical protein GE265_16285 [Streptomyces clavuligerus]
MAETSGRQRNEALRVLLDQADWSEAKLARSVNRLGTEAGMNLTYSQPSVAAWIRGSQPNKRARPLIVTAFERRLGRPVTYAEIGFTPPNSKEGDEPRDIVESLLQLGKDDVNPSRRSVLATSLYSVALPVPLFTEVMSADDRAHIAGPAGRIGRGEVDVVRRMTEKIADILDELGGGHARPMAAAFLVNTVAPYLRARATEEVHRDVLSAASDLTYLTGWMAMYERAHGLGQKYYLAALKLAGESQDQLTYCRTLRGMSLQASSLRHGRKALELADSAAEAAPKAGPRLVAFLRGQQAHAAAMVGDHRGASIRLREAESALSRADSRRESIGGYDRAAYLFHVSHVHYEGRDLPSSIKVLKQSIKAMPPQERQGQLHANAVLAQRQFELGHIEEACASWEVFLDDYMVLSTARGDEHFEKMRKSLALHRRVRAVRGMDEKVRLVAELKA